MSGRVGDLSPKQKEALAKVSRHPSPAPRWGRGLALPRQRAGKGPDGGRATVRDGRAAEGAAAGGTWRLAPLAPLAPAARPTLAAPVEEEDGGVGEVWLYPSLSPARALGGATWEEVVA